MKDLNYPFSATPYVCHGHGKIFKLGIENCIACEVRNLRAELAEAKARTAKDELLVLAMGNEWQARAEKAELESESWRRVAERCEQEKLEAFTENTGLINRNRDLMAANARRVEENAALREALKKADVLAASCGANVHGERYYNEGLLTLYREARRDGEGG